MDIAVVFHTGYDFESYLEKLNDDGLKFVSRYEKLALPEHFRAFLGKIHQPLKILVLSEPWCPDCVLHVPLLAKIAAEHADIQMMIFPRDQNPELAEYYALNQKKIIPAAIFMDEHFQEIGRWYERPAAVTEVFRRDGQEDRDEVKRKYLQGQFLDAALEEIQELLEDWEGVETE